MSEIDGSDDSGPSRRLMKSEAAFRTISEVSQDLGVPQHVLRFWESKFTQIKPLKRGGGRRYYRPEDIQLLRRVRDLLYRDGYTIRGAQNLLRGGRHGAVASVDVELAHPAAQEVSGDRRVEPVVSDSSPDSLATPVDTESSSPPAASVSDDPPVSLVRQDVDRAELLSLLAELEDMRRLLVVARDPASLE